MYLLMNKDNEIARFTITHGDFGDIYSFSADKTQKLPIGFDYIEKWLENRRASKHNTHLKQIMKDCGCDKAEGFIKVTHAASINDTFWIKNESEDIKWQDVSFYRNQFDEMISKLAFEGIGLYGIKLSHTSPELSTDGSFRKCWMREEGGIFLYKRGSSGARNAGLEPYCEVMSAEIAEKLCPDAVQYSLVSLHGELASKCRLFTDEQYGYVPSSRFSLNHSSPADLMRFYTELGSEELFRRMIILDALIFNVDRHAGNHGVLIENDTQKPVRMAPVFDLNMALLPYVEKEEFDDIGRKLEQYGPRIGDDFTRMGQQALTPDIRSDLIGLKGFRFAFRGDEKFPEWRVKAIEEIVNRQIEAVLNNEILQTKDVFIAKVRKEDKETKISEESSPYRAQEEKADEIAAKAMETGLFVGYDTEIRNEHLVLVMYPKSDERTEAYTDLETMDVWAETDGEQLSKFTCITDYPYVASACNAIESIVTGQELTLEESKEENVSRE